MMKKLARSLMENFHDYNNAEEYLPNLKRFIFKHRINSLIPLLDDNDDVTCLELIDENKSLIENSVKKYENQIKLLQKINSLSTEPVYPIKGFVPFLLTENQDLRKVSLDLDVIACNCKNTNELFMDNGFYDTGSSCDIHEYAIIKNDEKMWVEIHNFFPVYHRVSDQNNLSFSKISYDDIKNHSVRINFNDEWISLPGYEISALISCSHAYKAFAWEPYRIPCFRMMDIIEFYVLSKNKLFDINLFMKLVEKYKAYDAISFCSEIIDVYFDDNPFKGMKMNFHAGFKITNDRFGPWVDSKDQNFFKNLPTRTLPDIVQDLGWNRIYEDQNYSSENMAVQYCDGHPEPSDQFDFIVSLKDDMLTFTLTIGRCLNNRDNFLIHSSKEYGHLWIDKENRFYGSENIKYKVNEQDSFSIIKFELYHDEQRKDTNMIFVLGSGAYDNESITVVPMRISK